MHQDLIHVALLGAICVYLGVFLGLRQATWAPPWCGWVMLVGGVKMGPKMALEEPKMVIRSL